MENLILNNYPDQIYFPQVNFDYASGICEISGESYMEETYKFYQPIILWLTSYSAEKKPIIFNFKLTYFNTSSSRFIIEMLNVLKKHKETGGSLEVNWFYKKNDPDILTEIDDFMSDTGVHINTFPTQ